MWWIILACFMVGLWLWFGHNDHHDGGRWA